MSWFGFRIGSIGIGRIGLCVEATNPVLDLHVVYKFDCSSICINFASVDRPLFIMVAWLIMAITEPCHLHVCTCSTTVDAKATIQLFSETRYKSKYANMVPVCSLCKWKLTIFFLPLSAKCSYFVVFGKSSYKSSGLQGISPRIHECMPIA